MIDNDKKVMKAICRLCIDGKSAALETKIIESCTHPPVLDRERDEIQISIKSLERLGLIKGAGSREIEGGKKKDLGYKPTSQGEDWCLANRG